MARWKYVRLSPFLIEARPAVALATVTLLVGCSPSSASLTEATGSDVSPAADKASGLLTPEEFDVAYLACMDESGWVHSRDEFGQLSIELSKGQDADYDQASTTCASKFQVDPKYSEPLNDRQWEVIYNHYKQDVIPCLESLGYAPTTLPSLDVFIATANSSQAYDIVSPEIYNSIVEDVRAGRWEKPDDVIRGECEVVPPDADLYSNE